MATKSEEQTPLMQQYYSAKAKYPDAIFYYIEWVTLRNLRRRCHSNIQNTRHHAYQALPRLSRRRGTCRFPYHAIDTYLPKLVRAGQRVAICEQLEDPKNQETGKKGLSNSSPPGVSYNENTIDNKNNVFLAAVYFTKTKAGLSLLDLSTGEFLATEGTPLPWTKILNSFQPKEVLLP